MGLFDFLKNKPGDAPATPSPAASDPTPAPADKPAGGPRYQGAKFTAPAEPEPAVPTYQVPEPMPLPFAPENVLEQLLLLAATDEQARPAFYPALLQEEILMILAPTEGMEPGEVPQAVADAVTAWAASQPQLEAAYLAQMQVATNPDVPRLLLAFISTTPDPGFMQELGPVLEGKTDVYQFVDLMLLDVNSEEGVNPYFRTIEPFYKKG